MINDVHDFEEGKNGKCQRHKNVKMSQLAEAVKVLTTNEKFFIQTHTHRIF